MEPYRSFGPRRVPRWFPILAALVLLALAATGVAGASPQVTLAGILRDEQGLTRPDAILTLQPVSGSGQATTKTLQDGSFHIQVSPGQVLRNFDWKWLAGILLVGLLIPAIWRVVDSRKKKPAAHGPARGR